MTSRFNLTAAAFAAVAGPAFAEGDLEAGEKAFRKCLACHAIGEGAQHRTGPNLTGVIDRPAASMEGFSYSAAMTKAGGEGLVWTHESLGHFLQNPRKALPGTKMAFPGVRNPSEIKDILAYLGTFEAASGASGQPAADPAPEG